MNMTLSNTKYEYSTNAHGILFGNFNSYVTNRQFLLKIKILGHIFKAVMKDFDHILGNCLLVNLKFHVHVKTHAKLKNNVYNIVRYQKGNA